MTKYLPGVRRACPRNTSPATRNSGDSILSVSPAVLIPRPETEHLVETVLELARRVHRPKLVDVGTGSGCIALAFAHELQDAEVYAVDLSADALELRAPMRSGCNWIRRVRSCGAMFLSLWKKILLSAQTLGLSFRTPMLSSRARTLVRPKALFLGISRFRFRG